ncbi:MAG: 50S ribosomal protein L29 [Mycoplasmoidaceae bacterium]|nr:50S ribosomal protein L29 [Mycoplasmoidaceae bacterium]
MIKELNQKSNKELCTLIVKLKLQLLESRFKMAAGELEKTHKIKEIRKTIAQAFTVLNSRDIDLTIGTHGVTMYDRKNNVVKSINNLIDDSLEAKESSSKSKNAKATVEKSIADSTVAASKLEKPVHENTKIEQKTVSNQKLVSNKKTSTEVKRKVIGA